MTEQLTKIFYVHMILSIYVLGNKMIFYEVTKYLIKKVSSLGSF